MMKVSGSRSAVRRSVLGKSAGIWPLAINASAQPRLSKAAQAALLGSVGRAAAKTGLGGRALKWLGSRFSRYAELMRGGRGSLVNGYNAAKARVLDIAGKGLVQRNKRIQQLGQDLYGDLIRARLGGGHAQRVLNIPGGAQIVTDTRNVLSPETISELNKVLAARAGTAAGVVGAGTLGYNALKPKAAEAYEQGFIDKCAELGVDPDRLLKRAGLFRFLSADVRPVGAAAGVGGTAYGVGKAVSDKTGN